MSKSSDHKSFKSQTIQSDLFSVIGKGSKIKLSELNQHYSEFSTYFRPLMRDERVKINGWKFL